MSGNQIDHDSIEDRLREALAARADTVELGHLRPARLPATPPRWRLPLRRTAIVLLGVAAAAACALFAVTNGSSDRPVRPGVTPPHSVSPSTSPAPASPAKSVPPPPGTTSGEAPDPASPAIPTGP
ncbi:hypothetical protein [Streptomyces sp. NRRL B-24085]|uniref:hypothetical protein n=1 Tax=Streptomyces sp. NRRL B-24085 TaxID=1709476 RepID=UPI0006B38A25|nr:hypothetical protein [Streptomyces sp. NRRL B-24085]